MSSESDNDTITIEAMLEDENSNDGQMIVQIASEDEEVRSNFVASSEFFEVSLASEDAFEVVNEIYSFICFLIRATPDDCLFDPLLCAQVGRHLIALLQNESYFCEDAHAQKELLALFKVAITLSKILMEKRQYITEIYEFMAFVFNDACGFYKARSPMMSDDDPTPPFEPHSLIKSNALQYYANKGFDVCCIHFFAFRLEIVKAAKAADASIAIHKIENGITINMAYLLMQQLQQYFIEYKDTAVKVLHMLSLCGELLDLYSGEDLQEELKIDRNKEGKRLKKFPKVVETIVTKTFQGTITDASTDGVDGQPQNLAVFLLRFGCKCCANSMIEIRLMGMSSIKLCLDIWNSQNQNSTRYRQKICKYLSNQGKIFDLVFGTGLHLELVSRSTDLIIFFISHYELDRSNFDLMWTAIRTSQHQTVIHGICKLISLTIHLYDFDLLNLLVDNITSIFPDQKSLIDSQILFLVAETLNAILSIGPELEKPALILVTRLMEFLWNICCDEAELDQKVFNESRSHLVHYLQKHACSEVKSLFLSKCLDKLENHSSIPLALNILLVIESVGETSFPDSIIDKIRFLFFEDFKHYKTAARAAALSLPPQSAFEYLNLYGRNTHWEQINARLHFIQHFPCRRQNSGAAPLLSSVADILLLWDEMVVNHIGSVEKCNAFDCFSALNAASLYACIFDNRLSSLDFKNLSINGLHFVRLCIQSVNSVCQTRTIFDKDWANNLKSGEVLPIPKGIEFLWQAALCSEQSAVGREAIQLLVHTYITEHDPLKRTALVDLSLKYLMQTISTFKLPIVEGVKFDADNLKFTRCIEVLRLQLDSFYRKYPTSWTCTHRYRIEPCCHVKVQIPEFNKLVVSVEAKKTDSIGIFKKILLRHPSLPSTVKNVRLFVMGQDVSNDKKICDYINQSTGECAVFLATTKCIEAVEEKPDSEISEPSEIPVPSISSDRYFAALFDLLDLPEQQSKRIWDLICSLPSNSTFIKQIDQLETVSFPNWNIFYDSQSSFKLLYAIQTTLFVYHQKRSEGDSQAWSELFVKSGGLKALFEILLNGSIFMDTSSISVRRCIWNLLEVVSLVLPFYSFGDTVNITALTGKLFDLVEQCKDVEESNEVESSSSGIVSQVMRILFKSPAHDRFSKDIIEVMENSDFLSNMLISCTNEKVVIIVHSFLLEFFDSSIESRKNDPLVSSISRKLIQIIPLTENFVFHSSYFFKVLNHIIRNVTCPDQFSLLAPISDEKILVTNVISYINNHQISETNNALNIGNYDTVIEGLLIMAKHIFFNYKILKQNTEISHRLIDMVFNACLFEIPSQQLSGPTPPKCKSEQSRNAAFQLLDEICISSFENISALMEMISVRMADCKTGEWDYCPKFASKSACGYVGLVNLGATCYMNSLLQQFFMNSSLRSHLLSVCTADEDKNPDDNLFYQLKMLFANLQESERKSYDTSLFVSSVKDWDGNPTNPSVQMDVDEFFNILFDRIETALKGTDMSDLLDRQYGGKLLHQIKSKECPHVSEREENFFAIQCEVKNKGSLSESLQLYVEGEVLDGENKYFCGTCKTNVDAVKRTMIKSLPNNLIIHLKRFEYDLERGVRIKINDRFDFPNLLSMDQYTSMFLKDQETPTSDAIPEFLYSLSGVLVHAGTSNSGHYYSFIRDRSSTPRWFHFNDSNVESYDPNYLGKHCFGGSFENFDGKPNSLSGNVLKNYSAYMLFYEKVNNPLMIAQPKAKIFSSIRHDNRVFLNDTHFYDPAYFGLMKSLFFSMSAPFSRLVIDVGIRYFVNVLCHSSTSDNTLMKDIKEWSDFWIRVSSVEFECGLQLFAELSKASVVEGFLLKCYLEPIREVFVDLLMSVLLILNKNAGETQTNFKNDPASHPFSFELINTTSDLLTRSPKYWRNFKQFFLLLFKISVISDFELEYMLKKGMLVHFLDIYSWNYQKSKKRLLGDKIFTADTTHLTSLLLVLLPKVDIFAPSGSSEVAPYASTQEEKVLLFLNENGLYVIFSRLLLETPPELRSNAENILVAVSQNVPAFLEPLMCFLIPRSTIELKPQYFNVVLKIIQNTDEIQAQRWLALLVNAISKVLTNTNTVVFDFIVNSVIKFHSVLQSDASTTSKGDFFRDCILRELKGWVYILTHEVSGFRDPLEHLINSILISPCANSPAATVDRQKMLKEINNLMDMVIDLIPKNELVSIENYRSNKGKETVPFKNIFSLLRNCLFTIDEKEKISSCYPLFSFHLCKMFALKRKSDLNLSALLQLLCEASHECESMISQMCSDEIIMDIFSSTKMLTRLSVVTEQPSLLHYGILFLELCNNSPSFAQKITNETALKIFSYTLWNSERRLIWDVEAAFLRIFRFFIKNRSLDFRNRIVESFFNSSRPIIEDIDIFFKWFEIHSSFIVEESEILTLLGNNVLILLCKCINFTLISTDTPGAIRSLIMLEKFLGKCLIFDNVKNSGAFDEQAFIKLYKEDNLKPLFGLLKINCDTDTRKHAVTVLERFLDFSGFKSLYSTIVDTILSDATSWHSLVCQNSYPKEVLSNFYGKYSLFKSNSDAVNSAHGEVGFFVHIHPPILDSTDKKQAVIEEVYIPIYSYINRLMLLSLESSGTKDVKAIIKLNNLLALEALSTTTNITIQLNFCVVLLESHQNLLLEDTLTLNVLEAVLASPESSIDNLKYLNCIYPLLKEKMDSEKLRLWSAQIEALISCENALGDGRVTLLLLGLDFLEEIKNEFPIPVGALKRLKLFIDPLTTPTLTPIKKKIHSLVGDRTGI